MHQSVRDAWIQFNQPFEGILPFMYLDVKNLVTTGMGNLIDPVGEAMLVPFTNGGVPATADEIASEWRTVKSRTDLSQSGGGRFEQITRLRLSDDAIQNLVAGKLDANERVLKGFSAFAGLDDWPADAQMGLFSMAWAMGPAFGSHFPSFSRAAADRDWDTAGSECHMDETGNSGLRPRNAANLRLFALAAAVESEGSDFETLHFFDAD